MLVHVDVPHTCFSSTRLEMYECWQFSRATIVVTICVVLQPTTLAVLEFHPCHHRRIASLRVVSCIYNRACLAAGIVLHVNWAHSVRPSNYLPTGPRRNVLGREGWG